MKLENFNFNLPKELIAQQPCDDRDHSNLLIHDQNNHIEIKKFYEIIDYLNENDLIIFNNSKVLKAKLILTKGLKNIELYLTKKSEENDYQWQCFAKGAKKLKDGDIFEFNEHKIRIVKKLYMGEIIVEFILNNIEIFNFLEKYGEMPLPPYIKREEKNNNDNDRYQTIYSSETGSVAAPTAGLHFTEELLKKIRDKNIEICFVTLHVGAGTFLPIKTENIDDHIMHSEYGQIDQKSADQINNAKIAKRRIICVGSTSLRTIESSAQNDGIVKSGYFKTNIFIKPGYTFQIVDMLITNFHLPKSTLFILICAFIGEAKAHKIYEYAISHNLRFFSYGDACLLYR
jgi:S-adenosylmethionine:tRNA ribosyltransferase-isomerase